jgi:uncharacterized protein YccT (UPF0319 family)
MFENVRKVSENVRKVSENVQKLVGNVRKCSKNFQLYAQMIEIPSMNHRTVFRVAGLSGLVGLPRQGSGPALRFGLRI